MNQTLSQRLTGYRNTSYPAIFPGAPADSCMIWSATPTPFDDSLAIDHASIQRMIDHHDSLGVDGIFLAGTCGEGPWLDRRQTIDLVKSASDANGGRMKLGVQVTENSPSRTLERMEMLEDIPYDFAIIAQPGVFMNATPARVIGYYLEILDRSSKPVCFYDRGSRPDFPVEAQHLSEIYAHPKIQIIKDSSRSAARREAALQIRSERPNLALLNGDEFCCGEYLAAGYDGFMTGGAVLTGIYLRRLAEAFRSSNLSEAAEIDARARRLLTAVYGGPTIACWLTGLKHCLVEMGIFSSSASYLKYPLHDECREEISRLIREDYEWLMPTAAASTSKLHSVKE